MLARRKSHGITAKRNLIAKIKFLNELCYNLSDQEHLQKVTERVDEAICDAKSFLAINNKHEFICTSSDSKKLKRKKHVENNDLAKRIKPLKMSRRKHYFSGRVGKKAEIMRQFSKAKIALQDKSSNEIKIETEIVTFPYADIPNKSDHVQEQSSGVEREIITVSDDEMNLAQVKSSYEFELNETSIKILSSKNQWLDDNIINMSQDILANQFPEFGGFQDTGRKSFESPAKTFVQILHVDNNHWICITGFPEKSEVWYFDSLNSTLSSSTVHTIAKMLKTQDEEFLIHTKNAQKQPNGNDCGLFAIAFATDIVNNIDPSEQRYDNNSFRLHLLTCLQDRKITPFPKKKNALVPATNKER